MATRLGSHGVAALAELLDRAEVEAAPFEHAQSQIALLAYERYGKSRHPARLNICDCAFFALAKAMNAPFLFKGHDFAATDIAAAVG